MSQRASPNMFMVSLVAGLTGAAVGLLLAPRSGTETREKLKGKSKELKHKAHDSVASAREHLDENVDRAKELKHKLSEAVSSSGKKARQQMDELRNDSDDRPSNRQSPVLSAWEEEV